MRSFGVSEVTWGSRQWAIGGLQEAAEALFGRLVWGLQPVYYPCKMSYHHAKRCTAHKRNMQREDLETSWPATQTWSFSGPPTYFKSRYILEKLPQCFQH